MLQIDDYTLIPQGKTCSAHGGLLIYLHKHYKYKHLVGETSNIWEGQFIRVTDEETNTHVTIGNIHRPPRDVNENYQQFTEEFTRQLAKFQKSKGEVIIAGDYNIDLLKINNKPKITEYFDSILEHSFFPKITFPTRFSEHRGTLIDNFLCKLTNKFFEATAGIIVANISDHLPYFLCFGNVKAKIYCTKI